jgi:hypothetical protein
MQVLVLDGAPWEEGIPKRHVKLTSSNYQLGNNNGVVAGGSTILCNLLLQRRNGLFNSLFKAD